MRSPSVRALFSAALLTFSTSAAADTILPGPVTAMEKLLNASWPERLDARLGAAYLMARDEALVHGEHPWLGASATREGLRVTLRFVNPLTPDTGHAVERLGCRLSRLENGAMASVGRVVSARCGWAAFEPLAQLAILERVTPVFGRTPLAPEMPADATVKDIALDAVRAAHRTDADGHGVVIADIDTGVDVFHPFFFRADGALYDWLDNNGNGTFELGVDSIDANRDGEYQVGEMLGVIRAQLHQYDDTTGAEHKFTGGAPFTAGIDWLYQDENSDGRRNQGAQAPYGDQKPTFGEQLFVADDVNGNGHLDPGEKLVALKTPRIAAIRTGTGQVFRRGVNLSQVNFSAAEDPGHGSMVLGSAAGGQPGFGRYTGIAPGADLLLATTAGNDLVSALAWAQNEGAHIVLWEAANWAPEFLDGSSDLELACDTASSQGQLQLAAAGNLVGTRKHRLARHATGTSTVDVIVPPQQAHAAMATFLWRPSEGGDFSFSVNFNNQSVALTGANGSTTAQGVQLRWWSGTSARGTRMVGLELGSNGLLPGQTLHVEVTNAGTEAPLHGYALDDFSGWTVGVRFAVPDDSATYGSPAVGDHTAAIGSSYAVFTATGTMPGDLTLFSSRGPRIDGLDTIDLIAPEDHVTAGAFVGYTPGALLVGNGTSNALPVAGGAFAILKERHPSDTPVQLLARMKQYALAEPRMGSLPNDTWGAGKLNLFRALSDGQSPVAHVTPVAAGTATVRSAGWALDASQSTAGEPGPLHLRWDVDYDGHVDVETDDVHASAPASLVPGRFAKLEVQNAAGLVAQVLVPVTRDLSPSDAGIDTADGGSAVTLDAPAETLGPQTRGCGCHSTPLTLWSALALLAWARRRSV